MGWSDRQTAMLAEMGVRVWSPGEPQREQPPLADAGPLSEPIPEPIPEPITGPITEPVTHSVSEPRPFGAPAADAKAPTPPGSVDARQLDWPALRAVVAGCTACALSQSRTQTVFGIGHPRAHWMLVGEAPGEQEDQLGEPFVGRSGQLLDSMLRAVGLTRGAGEIAADADAARHVYIANTLKCRPPGNRNPAPEELQRCEGYLIRQIELVRPKIILAMGRFAVQSLLRSTEPVGRLRGRVHRYHGVPLIVTYHPAYLLRNLQDKARAWDDLCLALDTLEAAPAMAEAPD